MNDKIVAYIRQYRDIYTREAITARLIKAGYDEADINVAFEHLEVEPDKPQLIVIDEPRREVQGDIDEVLGVDKRKNDAAAWYDSALTGFLVYVIGSVLGVGLLTLISAGLTFLAVGGTLFLGLVLPSTLEKESPQFAQGIKYGFRTLVVLFIVLPSLGVLVIFGLCMTGNLNI
jgi:hypothetical protein